MFVTGDNKVLFVMLGMMFIYVNLVDRKYRYRIFCNAVMTIILWVVLRDFYGYIAPE